MFHDFSSSGETAHAGFPEVAYARYAATLVEKGYKVARIEQTETPAMMEERVKKMTKPSKFDKVVEREVCQVMTKGTRVNTFLDSHNYEGEPSYLLAVIEKPGPMFGVTFIIGFRARHYQRRQQHRTAAKPSLQKGRKPTAKRN